MELAKLSKRLDVGDSLEEELHKSRQAADKRGHSVAISVRLSPAWSRILEEVRASMPLLETQSDVVRFLLRLALFYLEKHPEETNQVLSRQLQLSKISSYLESEKIERRFFREWDDFLAALQVYLATRPKLFAKKVEELERLLEDVKDEDLREELGGALGRLKRAAEGTILPPRIPTP